MKRIATTLFASALLGVARAQNVPAGSIPSPHDYSPSIPELRAFTDRIRSQSTSSRSGQFIVFAPGWTPGHGLRPAPSGSNLITLEPRLLAISSERIKQSLSRTLGATADWQGRIYLNLRPARSIDDPVTLAADRLPGGWVYQVGLPSTLEQGRYVRTIVDALLLEMANRTAGSRSAEIPAWLAEGLAQELLAIGGVEFILPPPETTENGVTLERRTVHLTDAPATFGFDAQKLNPLAEAEQILRARPPLTFDQLSWPHREQLLGSAGAVYRSSAQLFVDQLLHLDDGPACFRAMLQDLPSRYNWQFAFLDGFKPHFQKLLDIEKWWALQLVQFAGRDLLQAWTPEESWRKLDAIVRSQVEVRPGHQELPLRTAVTLQKMIREWDVAQQRQMLQNKLQELNLIRPRVSQSLVLLVDDYRRVLGTYLQKRGGSGYVFPFGFGRAAGPISDRLTAETLKDLDALDSRRAELRPAGSSPVTAALDRSKP